MPSWLQRLLSLRIRVWRLGDRQRMGKTTAGGAQGAGGTPPHPFWMAALGSRLLRTQVMSRVKRKKKAAIAKHIR